MITKGRWLIPPSELSPAMIANERIGTESCGCAVYVGLRLDTHEVATVFDPCDEPGHETRGAAFNERLQAELERLHRDDPHGDLSATLQRVLDEVTP
jgi:hypothetical protein